jgi:acylphosphatase
LSGQKRVHVRVEGRVQGVFFRASTEQVARGLGVAGFVRNLEDGAVEVVAEGPERELRELVEFCRVGPRGARVTALSDTWMEATGAEARPFETK